ncbi:phosphoribosyltransferase [Methanohalobium sp.]|uniref:phosphoribosyltransferase n=1 Tax=Methanohalobium sp. TaxID=2837493 RepID=UPI0025F542F4|nr:phosphoribosyltransferase [Methanohalobium sp.]
MESNDKFKCVITNWEYIYNLCRDVSTEIKKSDFHPDIIIALARGGWFAGRVLCDFLGLDDLTSLKVEHYTGTAAISGEGAQIKYPISSDAVEDKDVLIVDDIIDTGESMKYAKEHVLEQNPKEVKTATLQYLYTSQVEPDYWSEYIDEWAWIVFPWNFMEDMINIISTLMKDKNEQFWDVNTLKSGLYKYYSIEPISFEIAQPGRLNEIMDEMERQGKVTSKQSDGKTVWKPVE